MAVNTKLQRVREKSDETGETDAAEMPGRPERADIRAPFDPSVHPRARSPHGAVFPSAGAGEALSFWPRRHLHRRVAALLVVCCPCMLLTELELRTHTSKATYCSGRVSMASSWGRAALGRRQRRPATPSRRRRDEKPTAQGAWPQPVLRGGPGSPFPARLIVRVSPPVLSVTPGPLFSDLSARFGMVKGGAG